VQKPEGPPIASWDAATGVWMREDSLLCGHSAPYSETWPMHGTTRGGRAFALSTWEHHTSAGESSSLPLLPTPVASDPNGSETLESWEARRALLEEKGYNANGAGTPLSIAVRRLLPTPEASDGTGGRVSSELGGTRPSGAKRAVTLASQLAHLLPTPTASDGDRTTPHYPRGNPTLSGALLPTPRAAAKRTSRRALVEEAQWSAPSLEQALELARGELPREYRSWDEVKGRSRLLPTPTASDGTGGAGHTTAEGSPNLRTTVAQLWTGEPSDPRSSAGSD
jgi:hypothetical protein